ncbi:hypothetical protein [Sphingobacterium sp. CZ-2]|uniref:hypothetical protein n=1 Tax=Sphingobacterium sp. CZ-2 TaxID=2557994 RepID=UPI0010702E69|nr:hypothetical protein [Sphingobacterium sp. CZ-2]QBR12845.1 hypothetical protein E3D81_12010 [Sphingobacterium sp. CZ-2]
MATKNENKKVGIVQEDRPKRKKSLTSVLEKQKKNQDADGETGVDPQMEQLNDMPDAHEHPKEPKKIKP